MVQTKTFVMTAAFAAALAGRVDAADWPQFRGPNHDGTSPEKILTTWPADGLRAIWKQPLTDGFSALTVGDGKAFTEVKRAVEGTDQELCVALDADTGKELWSAPLGLAKYDGGGDSGAPGNTGGDGPRSTPAYDSGKVYVYSSQMVLKCLDAATGHQVWACDVIREHDGQNIRWESAASPVVEGKWVFIAGGGPGQALLAFDKNDGKVAWKGQDDKMTQSTPMVATILGRHQVIFFTQKGLVSVTPETGEVLWRYPYKFQGSTAMTPLVSGDTVYCSAGYGIGTSACKITKTNSGFEASRLWFQPANVLENHWSTPVCSDGYVYGIGGQAQHATAPLVCVELATGKIAWTHNGFGPGGCTLVDGCVLVLSDSGDLVLVKATPDSYQEVARSHVLAGKCWNSAGVSGGRIYARSTREGVCVSVARP